MKDCLGVPWGCEQEASDVSGFLETCNTQLDHHPVPLLLARPGGTGGHLEGTDRACALSSVQQLQCWKDQWVSCLLSFAPLNPGLFTHTTVLPTPGEQPESQVLHPEDGQRS